MPKRITIDATNYGVQLAQAIVMAEPGDILIVPSETVKALGEDMSRRARPGLKINFVLASEYEQNGNGTQGRTRQGK